MSLTKKDYEEIEKQIKAKEKEIEANPKYMALPEEEVITKFYGYQVIANFGNSVLLYNGKRFIGATKREGNALMPGIYLYPLSLRLTVETQSSFSLNKHGGQEW